MGETTLAPAALRFRKAIDEQDVGAVRQLLENGEATPYVNAPLFSFGARPAMQVKNNLPLLDLLLAHGADINLRSDWWAGSWGILDNIDRATAEALIARGAVADIFSAAALDMRDRVIQLLDADPGLVHASGGDGCRPLHFAGSTEIMDLLLDRGADIEARDVDHVSTAAQWMTRKEPAGSIALAKYLLARGAEPDVFMLAAIGDAARLAALINQDATLLEKRIGDPGYDRVPPAPGEPIYVYHLGAGSAAVDVACAFGQQDCVDLLLTRMGPRDRFVFAAARGDRTAAEKIAQQHPAVLMELTPADDARLPKAVWDGNLAATEAMLDLGFNPGMSQASKANVLHNAAWKGRADLLAMLLNHPAVQRKLPELLEAQDAHHNATPLGWCCHGSLHCKNPEGDYAGVAQQLLTAGAARPDAAHVVASDEVKAVILRGG